MTPMPKESPRGPFASPSGKVGGLEKETTSSPSTVVQLIGGCSGSPQQQVQSWGSLFNNRQKALVSMHGTHFLFLGDLNVSWLLCGDCKVVSMVS